MVTQAPTRARRVASPQRWEAALARAIANGLEVFQVADTGERLVTSASRLDTLHRTDGYSCTCEAAFAGDECCQHRAVVRHLLGWLPEPEPVVAATATCGCGSPILHARATVDGTDLGATRCAACLLFGPAGGDGSATATVFDILVDDVGYRTYATRAEAEAGVAKFSRWKSTSLRVVIVERTIPAAVALPPRSAAAEPACLAA